MFCKAITSRGTPCIASCKAGSEYCHNHDKLPRAECPVCLEEVPHIRKLRCGHPLCVECYQRMQTNACPLCRRPGSYPIKMWRKLHELNELLYDLHDMKMRAFHDHVDWGVERYNSTQYIDTVTRVVDISCSIHSVVFRQPDFLAHISDGCGGIPRGKDDILCCVRRFHSCVDSFKHRTGFRPVYRGYKELPVLLYPLVPSCARYVSEVDRRWTEYREWQEWESRQTVHPLARNHLGYEWVPDP